MYWWMQVQWLLLRDWLDPGRLLVPLAGLFPDAGSLPSEAGSALVV